MRISVLIGFVESWKGTVNSRTISNWKLPVIKVVEILSAIKNWRFSQSIRSLIENVIYEYDKVYFIGGDLKDSKWTILESESSWRKWPWNNFTEIGEIGCDKSLQPIRPNNPWFMFVHFHNHDRLRIHDESSFMTVQFHEFQRTVHF